MAWRAFPAGIADVCKLDGQCHRLGRPAHGGTAGLGAAGFETLTCGYDGAPKGRRTDGWRAPRSSADTETGEAACFRFAERGCSAPQIMAYSGLKNLKDVQTYIQAATVLDSPGRRCKCRSRRTKTERGLSNLEARFDKMQHKRPMNKDIMAVLVGPEGLEPPTKAL
jgi:hypothetical protein